MTSGTTIFDTTIQAYTGSTGAPSIVFGGNTTGLYGNSNSIGFSTAGVERMTIGNTNTLINNQIRYIDGNQAIYSTLQSDASGNANWVGIKGIIRREAGGQTVNASNYDPLETDTTLFDSSDITESSNVYTLPEAGVYACFANVAFASNSIGTRNLYFIDSNAVQWGFIRQEPVSAGLSTSISTSPIIYWDGTGGPFTLTPTVGNTSSSNLAISNVYISIIKLL